MRPWLLLRACNLVGAVAPAVARSWPEVAYVDIRVLTTDGWRPGRVLEELFRRARPALVGAATTDPAQAFSTTRRSRFMARSEATVVVDRPINEVFDFLADGTNEARWREGVTAIALVSGNGLGAVYKQKLKGPGGRQIDGDFKITEYERPTRLGFQVIAGPVRPNGTFQLLDDGGRTMVTFSMDVKPTGFMKLAGPMIAKQVKREVDAVRNLKTVLERSA